MNPLIVTVEGLRIQSEMNTRDHWRARKRRFDAQKDLVLAALTQVPTKIRTALRKAQRIELTLVRLGGRKLDRDNLTSGMKACLDAVCNHWLLIDDGDEERLGITWTQETGGPYGMRLEFRISEQTE